MSAFTLQLPALLQTGHATISASYDAGEPYAITFGFDVVQPGLEWAISRELLADALVYGTAGVGEVKVTARGDLVVLGLSNPNGTGAIVLRRDDVDTLVARAHQLVAPGTEWQHLDWSDTTEFPGVAL
ncbi:SsgA family sporulation/cell division regulator [Amycolatopsis sp. FDAARGOS 1241]|uniref:SsgA family sporulation/cell division regulator n=1 Tax=Amycolatopsis sp. FDAARGOS 1241 TaxID=2778070 RepID=UPI001951135E|nr:SsgA family sporulation/cell division regulator [Amycolatopsis sp. FDAARGOS 1241]QRP46046.1 SsgA family sporulation/cell division regulator [Amycolatopsis sp. FDAARGOS 1241]